MINRQIHQIAFRLLCLRFRGVHAFIEIQWVVILIDHVTTFKHVYKPIAMDITYYEGECLHRLIQMIGIKRHFA